jgi:hypothetical protein
MGAVERTLTPEIRRTIGLPAYRPEPFRWAAATFVAVIAAIPLYLLGMLWLAVLVVFLLLVAIPAVKSLEHRSMLFREQIWRFGRETTGQVDYIEPGNEDKRFRLIRVTYEAEGRSIEAILIDSPLVRRGLRPGDVVKLLYSDSDPTQCLMVERVGHVDLPEEPAPAGGCGGGGCGDGGCGSHAVAKEGGFGGGGCKEGGCGDACKCGSGGCGGGGCGGGCAH